MRQYDSATAVNISPEDSGSSASGRQAKISKA